MIRPIPSPVSIFGWALAGLAFGAALKLGSYLGDLVTGDRSIDWTPAKDLFEMRQTEEPLWKRQFGKVSED
jgi:hypothetical protein